MDSSVADSWLQRRWSAFHAKHGDTVYSRVFVAWLVMMVFFWTYGGAMLSVDVRHRPRWIYARKYQPRRVFSAAATSYNASLRACVSNVLVNQLVVIPAGLLAMDAAAQRGWLRGIDMSERLPSPTTALAHALVALLLVELFFFLSHYALHTKALYASVHKVHHEFKAPYAIAAIYAHWFEALLGNTLAVMGPAFIVGMHGSVWYAMMVLGWLSTMTNHSGYGVPWSQKKNFHDLHHELFNINFGTFGWCDKLIGTYVEKSPPYVAAREK